MEKNINSGKNFKDLLPNQKFNRGGYVINRFGIVKNKPIGWYYRKLMCEIGWKFRNKHSLFWNIYYSNLNRMVNKYGINIYGERI